MADNISVKDGAGVSVTLATRDSAAVHTPKQMIADGDHVALGAKADASATSDTGTFSLIALTKRLLERLKAGSQTNANSVSVAPSKDQDPIYDHANGTKTSVTTSATVITPPAGCKFLRISSDVDVFVNTAGSAAVDDGTSIRIVANSPEVIPVTAATAVVALSSSGTATVRCMPYKER